MLYELTEIYLSTAKHNTKFLEAKPAEISRAPGLTASDLLFANVEQNTINKRAIENGQNKPIQNGQ